MSTTAITAGSETGWERVTLESDELRAVVLPGRGGDVLELEHRPTATPLLWRSPWPTPPGPRVAIDGQFLDWYQGGWQDLLPNGGPACTVDDVEHAEHGESWRRAWDVSVRDGGLDLELSLETLPLRVRKRIELTGPTLRIRERIRNVGGRPVRLMWGQHPAWGGDLLEAGCRVDLPGGRLEGWGAEVDATSELAPHGRGRWPHLPDRDGGVVDLSVIPGPDHGTHDICVLGDLEDGWYALRNPRRGIGVALAFPADVFRWLWMWRPFGGFTLPPFHQGTYALALEPWTSPPSLSAAIERGAERRLTPGQSLAAEIELTAFVADERPVMGVGPRGEIVLA